MRGGLPMPRSSIYFPISKKRALELDFIFAWFDMWVGLYVATTKPIIFYIFPFPMLGLRVEVHHRD